MELNVFIATSDDITITLTNNHGLSSGPHCVPVTVRLMQMVDICVVSTLTDNVLETELLLCLVPYRP